MAPFKPLLSPKTRFVWTTDLDEAFCRSKVELVEAIKQGVRIFDPHRRTCLNSDWSKTGIGYWLQQKLQTVVTRDGKSHWQDHDF